MYTAAKSENRRDNVTKKMKTSDVIVRDMNLPFLRKTERLRSYLAHRYSLFWHSISDTRDEVTVTFYSD